MGKCMATRTQVIELRVNNPRATLQQIGDNRHISRERVRQILQEEGLPTGAEVDRVFKFCKTCGKRLAQINKAGYCQKHLKDGITHCPSGHPYNEENTHTDSNGNRKCRVCVRARAYFYYWQHREAILCRRPHKEVEKE